MPQVATPSLRRPDFRVSLTEEAFDSIQTSMDEMNKGLRVVESITGRILTLANQQRKGSIIKLCHDVFQSLFEVPRKFKAAQRSMTSWEPTLGVPYSQFKHVDIAWVVIIKTKAPEDRVLKEGQTLNLTRDAGYNIPSMIHRAKLEGEFEAEDVFGVLIEELRTAVRELHTACTNMMDTALPSRKFYTATYTEWKTTTEEGKAYAEQEKKHLDGVFATIKEANRKEG